MEQTHDSRWERSLEQVARRFDYPPTPAIADNLRRPTADGRPPTSAGRRAGGRPSAVSRRLALALLLVAFAAALLAAPPTRAAILAFFARVGAIEIFVDETAPTAAPSTAVPSTPAPPPTALPAITSAPTGAGTASRPVAHSLSLFDLGQPTTLAEAGRAVGFTPHLPAALGEPDEVYHHRVDLPAVTYVWRGPDGVPLSLTQIGIAEFARKMVGGGNVEDTTVNDAPAVWLTGPHTLQLLGDRPPGALLITSNVLIWAQDGFTYRLEGNLTLEEAVAIAESVAPTPTPTTD